METRVCLLVVVILATVALVGCKGEEEETSPAATVPAAGATTPPRTTSPTVTPPAAPATPTTSNGMAVDALPGGPVDVTRTVSKGTPFEVDVVVTVAPNAYKAFQYTLQWDPAVLAYRDLTYPKAGGLDVCPPPTTAASTVYGGCAGFSPTDFVGTVSTITLECIGAGTSLLHLQTLSEDPSFGTATTFAPGRPSPTMLTDASVSCE
ncbi:MAG: hypothetical protein WBF37_05250 [Dehalococcoidia bacterium]